MITKQIELNKIYCGDCLEIMKELPDKSIDLVLTDPPYGVKKTTWDDEIPSIEIWDEVFRVSKIGANILVFGGIKLLPLVMTRLGSVFDYQWVFVWYKSNASQFGKTGYSKLDIILWYAKGKTIAKHKKLDVIIEPIIPSKNNFGHPTPKPIKVMTHIIECLSNEGEIFLDPFVGSGTTAVACKLLDRNFIGIEINQAYVDIANKRLANTYRQLELI